MNRLISLLFLVVLLNSCNNELKNEDSGENKVIIDPNSNTNLTDSLLLKADIVEVKDTTYDIQDFIKEFSNDSLFQISHIKFPLIFKSREMFEDTVVELIKKEDLT